MSGLGACNAPLRIPRIERSCEVEITLLCARYYGHKGRHRVEEFAYVQKGQNDLTTHAKITWEQEYE